MYNSSQKHISKQSLNNKTCRWNIQEHKIIKKCKIDRKRKRSLEHLRSLTKRIQHLKSNANLGLPVSIWEGVRAPICTQSKTKLQPRGCLLRTCLNSSSIKLAGMLGATRAGWRGMTLKMPCHKIGGHMKRKRGRSRLARLKNLSRKTSISHSKW
jgi:hypothetical protein